MANAAPTATYGPCDIVMGYRSLMPLVPQGSGLCLELGARRGVFRRIAEARGYRYIGIDIDPYPQLAAVGDAHAVPFRNASFDFILLPCVLEHFRDPRIALQEVFRVAKPGAFICGQVAFLEPFHHSYFHFSHEALEDAMAVAGFTDLTIDTGANAFVLIYARLFAQLFGLHNRKAVVLLSRILFPINLVMKGLYVAGLLKNMLQRRDVAVFRERFETLRRGIALSIAGHIIFTAVKPT